MRKAATATAPARTDDQERIQKIDEYGELKRQEALFKPASDRLKQLREEINGWYANEPADKPVTVHGRLYILTLTPRENERSIVSMAKLFTAAGRTTFLRLCRFPLTAFDQLKLPAELVTTARTGPRTISAVPKSPMAA